MTGEQVYYKQGYKKEIADSHAGRNVSNSAEYLIPYLKPDFKILDVGSGPGSITIDFGNYIPEGHITGVEPTIELIDRSNAALKATEDRVGKTITNVSFQIGSIYNLPFEDNTFDLVHAHQVILHLEDPIAALKELKRVAKVGGLVGVRDGDLESVVVYPAKLEATLKFVATAKARSGPTDIFAGRSLRSKAIKAGYSPELINSSASIRALANKNSKESYSQGITARLKASGEKLFSDDEELDKKKKEEIIQVYHEFIENEESFLTMQNGEFVYTKE